MEGPRGLYREHVQRNKKTTTCVYMCVCAPARAFPRLRPGRGFQVHPRGSGAGGSPTVGLVWGAHGGGAGTHTKAW